MSCDNLPTTAEIEQAKKDIIDFNTFMTSTSDTFVDSKSVSRLTLQGAINKFGFDTADFTFTEGGTLSNRKLLVSNDPIDGLLYRYVGAGTFPITVTAGTDPTMGTDWEAFTATSAEFISNANGGSVQDFIDESVIKNFELYSRSYAQAGYNLVDGSFEAGGTLVNANDVLLQERTGKAFTGPAGVVAAGTDPSSPSFTSRHLETLRSQVALNSKVITFKIPTDFPDLPSALSECAKYHGSGNKITVLIESGHALTKGYRFDNVDLGFVSIKSEDAVVTCSPSFIPVSTTDLDAGLSRSFANMFVSIGGEAPEWGIKVSASGLDMPIGYLLGQYARGKILPGCGVINTTYSAGDGIGIAVRTASSLDGYQAVATGCDVGIAITKGSKASIAESNTTGCTVTGVDVSRGSLVYMNDSIVGGVTYGLYARRSWVAAQGCTYVGTQSRNISAALGSRVIAANSVMPAGASVVAYVEQGSEVDLSDSTKNGVLVKANDVYPKAINVRTKQGVISAQHRPSSTAVAATSDTSAMTVTAASSSIDTLTYLEVLNLSGARILRGGSIYGRDVGVRITVDGVVVLNDISRAQGKDSAGDDISMVSLPYCASQTSLIVEVYNRSSVASQIGWKMYTVAA